MKINSDYSRLGFPTGIPILIHSQFDGDGLSTAIGLVIHCHDALQGGTTYCGTVDAAIIRHNSIYIERGINHFNERTSACYWVHVPDYQVMIDDFKNSWNAENVKSDVMDLLYPLFSTPINP